MLLVAVIDLIHRSGLACSRFPLWSFEDPSVGGLLRVRISGEMAIADGRGTEEHTDSLKGRRRRRQNNIGFITKEQEKGANPPLQTENDEVKLRLEPAI